MDYGDALSAALKKEKAAVQMYKDYSLKHPILRELFESLANEEEKHVALIEKKIAELMKP